MKNFLLYKIRAVFFVLFFIIITFDSVVYADSAISFDGEFYENLFRDHGSIMMLLEPESGKIVDANLAASNFYGYSISELESMTIQQINTLTPEEVALERQAALKEERNYFIFRHKLSSGEIRTVEVYSYPVIQQDQQFLFSLVLDITDKIAMEQSLQQRQRTILILASISAILLLISTLTYMRFNRQRKNNEKQLQAWNNLTRHIIQNSPNAIAVHDKNMKYIFVSKKYIETYRVNDPDIIGKHHYEVFPDLPEKWREVHKRVLNGAIESADDDPYYRDDGTVDYTRWEARPWYEVNGDIGGIIIYTEIINEWKNQMQSLKESEERFRLLVETAPDSIFVYIDKKLAYANHTAAKLVGFSNPDEVIGSYFKDLLNPESNSEVENQYRVFLEEKTPIYNVEQSFLLANGKSIDVEINAVPIKYSGKDGELVYVRDISDRKRTEKEKDERLQQERHQQKLESIGTLASGVAHEINNPVTGIINYAQLILDEADPTCDCSTFAKEIMAESLRIAEIVQNLLVFSRNEKQSHSRADINDIVNQTLTLIRALIRKDQIEIQLNVPEDLPPLKCRSQQIQQVLMNLLTNARDALNIKYPESHENKIITISAYMYHFEGRRWIRLTVEDFGNGIPETVRDRIFDPFFTTKSKEMGTGLGLPISYGIVKDHHGNLTFETSIGEFTRFHLDLPVDNGWHI